MMSVVAKKLGHKSWLEGVVEDSGRNTVKNRLIAGTKDLDLRCHD
jgi:hypothetical protein